MKSAVTGCLIVGVLLVSGVATAQVGGEPDAAPDGELDRELEALAAQPGAVEAAGPVLEQAREALRQAVSLRAAGNVERAERAEQLAGAALTLASRKLALVRERRALRDSRGRAGEMRARAQQAAAARAHAERQLAELRVARHRPDEPSPEPEDAEEGE